MSTTNKRGKQSFVLPNKPVITHWASVAGKKESQGPLAGFFDHTNQDTLFGQKSWELAENRMQQLALEHLAQKANMKKEDFSLVYSGDLLNQCISSSFSLNNTGLCHLGLYGACSTMAESLLMASMSVGGGFSDKVIAMTSSHFASSERQYRFPLGYGGQRTPTAQWTVTGSGAALVCREGMGPKVDCCPIGTVPDLGIKDANNMGAAMAPAALQTIKAHFRDMNRSADDFDLIVTGDLGQVGKEALLALSRKEGILMGGKLVDCGCMVFDLQKQDVHAGRSGCGCSAITLCSDLLGKLSAGKLRRILFCGTGALLSPTSTQQGLAIPGVCHAVSITGGKTWSS